MAVQFAGGVIIGADSRTTTGSYIANRVTDKLTQIHDQVFCCRSGSAADTQAVADMMHYYCQLYSVQHGEAPTVRVVSSLFREICYNNKDSLQAGIIVAGWDKYHGGEVYSVPLGGSLHKQPFAIGGSGSTYIYGFCDAEFKDGMTRDECISFVSRGSIYKMITLIKAISHAMARDGSSGGTIRLAIIDEAGVQRVFIPGDKLPKHYEL